ncbi:MAG: protein-L-isoaspartate O-methyltransferase [Candidatus Wildermuthbacteria bacterium]|nr:protein-L-isoaspartate O-methyltransferase [Candidatus Wildermuthbacteria bacterium]
MDELVNELKEQGFLASPLLAKAFLAIDRQDFVPEESKPFAYVNEAIPTLAGQTISQPAVVAFMLEKLDPQPGDKILDIGAGSGWTTALLSYIAGKNGKVIGIELIPEVAEFGKKNIAKYNFIKKGIAKYLCQDGSKGCLKEAPFNKILISASLPAKNIPPALKDQLAANGCIVTPIRKSVWKLTKIDDDGFEAKEYPGFLFVPFKIDSRHKSEDSYD